MELLNLFKEHLLNQSGSALRKPASKATVKNYLADVRHFIKWFEEAYQQDFFPQAVSELAVTRYKTFCEQQTAGSQQLSARSLKRHMSSLRKFFDFLMVENIIAKSPIPVLPKTHDLPLDLWHIKGFKEYLYLGGASHHTIKNYIIDVQAFMKWCEGALGEDAFSKITPFTIEEYKNRLINILHFSPNSVNRKLSSIRKYLVFAQKEELINADALFIANIKAQEDITPTISLEEMVLDKEKKQSYSAVPPIRLIQKLTKPYGALENKIASIIAKSIKENKYKTQTPLPQDLKYEQIIGRIKNIKKEFYAPYSISIDGYSAHQKLFHHLKHTRPNWYKKYHSYSFSNYFHFAILVVFASGVGIVMFQKFFPNQDMKGFVLGTAAPSRTLSFQGRLTDVSDNPITTPTNIKFAIYNSPTASEKLWEETQSQVSFDKNGFFSVMLGTNIPIPDKVFLDNLSLYLGIAVNDTEELSPRQKLATTSYASDSNTLQGMTPITALNAGTSNVVLALDSTGNLSMGGSASPTFEATGGQFKLSGQSLVLATSASSNGNVVVAPDGIGMIDLQRPLINTGGSGSVAPGGVEIEDQLGVISSDAGTAAVIINKNSAAGDILSASSSGTTRFTIANDGSLITSKYKTAGGLLFTDSQGNFSQTAGGNVGQCLISTSGSMPLWGSCGAAATWTVANNTISPIDLNTDFLLGESSTNSAKFLISNMTSGTPIASISATSGTGLSFSADGTIQSLNNKNLTLGGITTGNIILNPLDGKGSVGIGTSTPSARFQVGNQGDGTVAVANAWNNFSDIRLKENITPLSDSLNKVMTLKGVAFNWRNSGQASIGFIAQDVEKVLPEIVTTDSNGFKSLDYGKITPLLVNAIQEQQDQISNFKFQISNIISGIINVQTIVASALNITTDSITISGQSLKDYVVQIINSQFSIFNSEKIISPLAEIDKIHTNIISPLAHDSNISIDLKDSRLTIRDSRDGSGSAVTEFDNHGNATFSGSLASERITVNEATVAGQLATNNLTANNATVSGTLRADKIIANEIDGLDERIASFASSFQNTTSSSGILDLQSLAMSYEPITNYFDISTISASFATFHEGLISFGPTTLEQVSVLDSVSIGTNFIISSNSINLLGGDLEIQPLRQGGISFLAGAVRINTDGTLTVNEDAIFGKDVKVKGTLSANIIAPLPNQDLTVSIPDSRFTITDASGGDALSVNQTGDLIASGSGTFGKINLSLTAPAYAISDTQAIATGSAGTAVLKKYKSELTIFNNLITDKSLIYVTPVGNTNAIISLLRQTPNSVYNQGSFTVGSSSISTQDVQFNWIIVN